MPDDAAQRAWREYQRAEDEFYARRFALLQTDYIPVVRAALDGGDGYRAAVRLLAALPPERAAPFLDLLLQRVVENGAEAGWLQQLILAANRSDVDDLLPGLVDRVIGAKPPDDHEYRALASLLHQLDRADLLAVVVSAASESSDPDVREVAEDFPMK